VGLTSDELLVFQGFNGCTGLCHARVYERPGGLPVVIVGQLDDNPGTFPSTAIEMIAAAVQSTFFADKREFRLVQYYSPKFPGPSFVEVQFAHRSVDENPQDPGQYTGVVYLADGEGRLTQVSRGSPKEGDFRDPRWKPIEDIELLVGCQVKEWPARQYTARNLFGEAGARVRDAVAQQAHEAARQLAALLQPDRHPPAE
jgi:hypothetical protein